MMVLPYLIERENARGNLGYDGAAVNVALFVFGWIPAIVIALPSLIIGCFVEAIMSLRQGLNEGDAEAVRYEPGEGPGWS